MQDGSAAGRNTVQWRNIFFRSTLTGTSLPPHARLVVPAQFVKDHGEKFNDIATLKNAENNKMRTVTIDVQFSENRPEDPPLVLLQGRGWRAFTTANDLAIGDQLTFALVAQSKFHVSILRGGGNSSRSVEKTKIRSRKPIPKRRKTNPATKLRAAPKLRNQLGCGVPNNACEGSAEVTRTDNLLVKETAKETGVAAEAPDPSPSPSGMDSHGFELMIPQEVTQQDCIICQLAAMTKLDMMKAFGAGFHTVLNE